MNTVDILSIHSYLVRKYQTEQTTTAAETMSPSSSPILYFYLMRAIPLLEKYKDLQKSQAKISFIGKGSPQTTEAMETTVKEFIKLVEEYFEEDFRYHELDDRKHRSSGGSNSNTSRNGSKIKCLACNVDNDCFSIYDNHFVCDSCGLVSENTHSHISYKDIDRVNITSKYTYDRRTHFRDCINQFQGKQNVSIDSNVYDALLKQFVLHDLVPANYKDLPKEEAMSKITKEHITLFLKETGFSKHYEDVVLIHATLTGKPAPDISHLENDLIYDFDVLTDIYDKKYKNASDRKNFINTQYVLYQLLRRHKYPCRKEDFNILKTIDRKYYHDVVCAELFQQVGWNLHPLF